MSRSPDEIERDIEVTRARLVDTVTQIERRLTPGRLLDDMLEGLLNGGNRGSDKGAGREMSDMFRRHPLPVLLVGAGLAWLVLSGGRRERPVHAVPMVPPPPADEWPERLRSPATDVPMASDAPSPLRDDPPFR